MAGMPGNGPRFMTTGGDLLPGLLISLEFSSARRVGGCVRASARGRKAGRVSGVLDAARVFPL
jgi:hypothetical protein